MVYLVDDDGDGDGGDDDHPPLLDDGFVDNTDDAYLNGMNNKLNFVPHPCLQKINLLYNQLVNIKI